MSGAGEPVRQTKLRGGTVIYRLQEDGSLLARIEGMEDGKARGVDFPMQRAPCPDTAAH
jgi:hypothetical protein